VLEGLGLDVRAVLVERRLTVWVTAGDVLALKLASPP
jgi:hypothetical protein